MNNRQTKIMLVRHGQSTYNAQKLYQGCCDDSVLTEKGRLQAYQTGLALSKLSIDAVYSSPLRRTQETAGEILTAIDTVNDSIRRLEIQTHPHLQEIDLPEWQGLSFQHVRENLAEDYRIWREKPHQFSIAPREVENISGSKEINIATLTKESETSDKIQYPVLNLHQRAEEFWQEILSRHAGETILIVSHGGTIRALINAAIGIKSDRFHYLQQSNCGISILEFNERSTRLEAMNLTSHLGEVLPKLKEGKLGMRLLLLPTEKTENFSIQLLARSLHQVPIDFCIHSDCTEARVMTDLFFCDCATAQPSDRDSSTVHLQASQQNFLQIWHQTIQSQSRSGESLVTGLAIADRNTIQSALTEILGIVSNTSALNLKNGTISVLQYPLSTNHPILQTLNFEDISSAIN
jgi:probable phosphoglycerate mutase